MAPALKKLQVAKERSYLQGVTLTSRHSGPAPLTEGSTGAGVERGARQHSPSRACRKEDTLPAPLASAPPPFVHQVPWGSDQDRDGAPACDAPDAGAVAAAGPA